MGHLHMQAVYTSAPHNYTLITILIAVMYRGMLI